MTNDTADRSVAWNALYRLSAADANTLAGISLMPPALRRDALVRMAEERGAAAMAALFAEFIGLANSVVHNNREMIEMVLIETGTEHPHRADRINLPTILGALAGVRLEGIDPESLCLGCAFRIGTPANQSPTTTIDAGQCVEGEGPFWCHEKFDEDGAPVRGCAGYARARARDKALGSDAAPRPLDDRELDLALARRSPEAARLKLTELHTLRLITDEQIRRFGEPLGMTFKETG